MTHDSQMREKDNVHKEQSKMGRMLSMALTCTKKTNKKNTQLLSAFFFLELLGELNCFFYVT